MPRATTAAWLVMPPRAVRMPLAACMPWMSSGLVSARTRITSRFSAASFSASSAVNTASPVAAPGEAARPIAICSRGAFGIERRMQKLVQRRRIDARHRGADVDQPFALHVDRDLERGFRRALAAARLEHEELAFLHREFQVLHVAVVVLQPVADRFQLGEGLGHRLLHREALGALALAHDLGDRLRRADTATTSSPCALIRNSP